MENRDDFYLLKLREVMDESWWEFCRNLSF